MKLENANIRVSFSSEGAQMVSFLDKKTKKEWVWSGDKQFWGQHNPILFPIVGSTYDKKIRFENQVTEMGNHGFTRYAQFKLIKEDDHLIQWLLQDDENTFAQYPYHFKLWVDYYLNEHSVDVVYRIENNSDDMMPFCFGLHPAFSTQSDGVHGKIHIEFACPEINVPDQIKSPSTKYSVFLDDAFFEEVPTWMITAPKSPFVTLREQGHGMRVHVQGYRYLAFWKKAKAPFICIEPWHAHDDFEVNEAILFKDRKDTLWLHPQRSYVSSIRYELIKEKNND
jgi:galactose mutarotase-like enzyme